MKRVLLAAILLAVSATAAHSFWRDVEQASRIRIDVQEYRLAAVAEKPAPAKPAKYEARMYGMTGLLGRLLNFSSGVDASLAKVAKDYPTIKTYPRRHIDKWRVLATAEANYRIDGLPIILSGHSMGADAAIWVAHRLNEKGIPVAALFSYDPTPLKPCVPDNVQVVIGWRNTLPLQLGGGLIEWCSKPAPGSPRAMERYDLRDFHTNIDDRADVIAKTAKHAGEVVHMLREMRGAQ